MSTDGPPVARFVLTGAPGAGKTAVARALSGLGYEVMPEASVQVAGVSAWLGPAP